MLLNIQIIGINTTCGLRFIFLRPALENCCFFLKNPLQMWEMLERSTPFVDDLTCTLVFLVIMSPFSEIC